VYRTLNHQKILDTLEALTRRIDERFPDSGLGRVSHELLTLASASEEHLERLRRPNWPVRSLVGAGLLAIVTILASAVMAVRVQGSFGGLSDLLQGLEAAINDIAFLGIAVFFLFGVEGRLKRRLALQRLHELRSIAHVIDMHQLTKDPENLFLPQPPTASSPKRRMTPAQLGRYLDYCSELLSLINKLAALYVQHLNDSVVLEAVDGLQGLTTGLSGKIWQKIVLLDALAARAREGE
jgi:hypothetical protein